MDRLVPILVSIVVVGCAIALFTNLGLSKPSPEEAPYKVTYSLGSKIYENAIDEGCGSLVLDGYWYKSFPMGWKYTEKKFTICGEYQIEER